MATAPMVGGPNNPNEGIMQAAYEAAKKDIPTAYGRAEVINNQAAPGTELIDKVPGVTQPEAAPDVDPARFVEAAKNWAEVSKVTINMSPQELRHYANNLSEAAGFLVIAAQLKEEQTGPK